jgi:hypothetical protein
VRCKVGAWEPRVEVEGNHSPSLSHLQSGRLPVLGIQVKVAFDIDVGNASAAAYIIYFWTRRGFIHQCVVKYLDFRRDIIRNCYWSCIHGLPFKTQCIEDVFFSFNNVCMVYVSLFICLKFSNIKDISVIFFILYLLYVFRYIFEDESLKVNEETTPDILHGRRISCKNMVRITCRIFGLHVSFYNTLLCFQVPYLRSTFVYFLGPK